MIRMNRCALFLLAFLVFASPLLAQLEDTDETTKAKCAAYSKTPLPIEATEIDAPKAWPECNSYKSYSGIGTNTDFAAARKCAWSERLAQQANLEPRFSGASVFGGSAMLAVLYANGEGIERNIPLALRFACEAGGAPAEIEGRLQSLEALGNVSTSQRKKISFCDDITSGFMEGFCAAYSSEIAEQERARSWDTLKAQWTTEHRAAFAHLLAAEKVYAKAHAKGEIDLSGTARAMFQIDAEDSILDDFHTAIADFEKGDLPHASHGDALAADQRLNAVYRGKLADVEAHKSDYGAVQPDGVRSAERAWLRYRDTFVTFAGLHYPSVSPDAWLTLLTKDRISVIDGRFCDMDAQDGPCAQPGDRWKPSPLP
jgi:hypothetical protein